MKVNDLNPYPPGIAPVTGPAGSLFIDPAFQTPVLRITDENDPGANGQMFANGYSAIYDLFNFDSTWIAYLSLGGNSYIANIDPVNKKLISKRALTRSSPYVYWSRIDPNTLYMVDDWFSGGIWSYQVAQDKWTLLIDVSTLLPGMKSTSPASWMTSRGMSWDDHRFHIYSPILNVNFYCDVSKGIISNPITYAQAQAALPSLPQSDWAKTTMDGSGSWFVTANIQLVINLDTAVMIPTEFNTSTRPYGDVHNDFGNGFMGGCGGMGTSGGPSDGYYPYLGGPIDPNNLSTYLSARKELGPRITWGFDAHCSFRAKAMDWITYVYDGGPGSGADLGKVPILGNQEIFQLAVNSPPDGSLNRRIAHHYSDSSQFPDAPTKYWASPHASMSQDGRLVGWNSTYGNKRIDLYIAFLEPVPPPPPITGDLAGVTFSHDEALVLKSFAQSILSQQKGGGRN